MPKPRTAHRRTAHHRTVLRPVLLAAAAVALLATACASRDGGKPRPVFHQVTAPVAFEMMHDFPDLPVIDLRPAADYHGPSGHIRGAFNAPFEALPELLRDIAYLKEETFLIYCQAHECEPSVLDWFRDRGFENAMLIHGGIEAWIDAGFGTVGAGAPEGHEGEG